MAARVFYLFIFAGLSYSLSFAAGDSTRIRLRASAATFVNPAFSHFERHSNYFSKTGSSELLPAKDWDLRHGYLAGLEGIYGSRSSKIVAGVFYSYSTASY